MPFLYALEYVSIFLREFCGAIFFKHFAPNFQSRAFHESDVGLELSYIRLRRLWTSAAARKAAIEAIYLLLLTERSFQCSRQNVGDQRVLLFLKVYCEWSSRLYCVNWQKIYSKVKCWWTQCLVESSVAVAFTHFFRKGATIIHFNLKKCVK